MVAPDYIVVGSGINALVAAALLGRKGRSVLVLERNDRPGGCILSDEIVAPGFVHDVMATTFVLFTTSPAYACLGKDLSRHGLSFAESPLPTGVLLPDGRCAVLSMERASNIKSFEALATGDGQSYAEDVRTIEADAEFLFALLGGRLWSLATAKLLARQIWRRGPRGLAAFFGKSLETARAWLETNYRSQEMQALWAPWVLHNGLTPDQTYSGQIGKVIAFALEAAGAPIVKGGAQRLLDAFGALIAEQGGEIRTKADVAAILRDDKGAAAGVRLADGQSLSAVRGVICSVTPTQLYDRLLADCPLPEAFRRQVKGYRYGNGNIQIHYALSKPPAWKTPGLDKVALLHLTSGLDGVSKAANEAIRGLLPQAPTICVGQPSSLDPSRCPEGSAILWLQLPEAPRLLKGDAAQEIETPPDGQWTKEICERYGDRAEAILARHIEGFSESIVGRRCYSPLDLEALNVNLAGGDPYGGFCGLDQLFLWRPFKESINHTTPVANLYHIGASTHPGPGLGGGSGYLLAQSLS